MSQKISIIFLILSLVVGVVGISVGAENLYSLSQVDSEVNLRQANSPDLNLSIAPLSVSRPTESGSFDIAGNNTIGVNSRDNVQYAQITKTRADLLQEAGQKLTQFRNQYYLCQIGTIIGGVLVGVGSATVPPNETLTVTGSVITIVFGVWNLFNWNKIGVAGKKLQEAGGAS